MRRHRTTEHFATMLPWALAVVGVLAGCGSEVPAVGARDVPADGGPDVPVMDRASDPGMADVVMEPAPSDAALELAGERPPVDVTDVVVTALDVASRDVVMDVVVEAPRPDVTEVVDVAGGPPSDVVPDAGGPCDAHRFEGTAVAVALHGVEPVADGDPREWAGILPQITDPSTAMDPCEPRGGRDLDLASVALTQTESLVGARVRIGARPLPGMELVLHLRRVWADPVLRRELVVSVGYDGRMWNGAVDALASDGRPTMVARVFASDDGEGWELAFPRQAVGSLADFRVQVEVARGPLADASRVVQPALAPGVADARGVVFRPGRLRVTLAPAGTEAALRRVAATLPGGALESFNALGRSGVVTFAGSTVEAIVAARATLLADAAVGFAVPDIVFEEETTLGRNDLRDYLGHEHDAAIWAYTYTRVFEAQALVEACSPWAPPVRTRVAVVDADMPGAVGDLADAHWVDTVARTVTLAPGERPAEPGVVLDRQVFSHGLGVASILGARIDRPSARTPVVLPCALGEGVVMESCPYFPGDRLSGVLAFDGTGPAFTYPLEVDLINRRIQGVQSLGDAEVFALAVARGARVVNASFGARVGDDRVYCREPRCIVDGVDRCHGNCDGLSGGRRGGYPPEGIDQLGAAWGGVIASPEGSNVVWVVSAGNDCDVMDRRRVVEGVGSTGARHVVGVVAGRPNVLVVGSVKLLPGERLGRARHSNHGDPVNIAAPGINVLNLRQRVRVVHRVDADGRRTIATTLVPSARGDAPVCLQPRLPSGRFAYDTPEDYARYGVSDGTSYAAPMVSAAATLLRSLNPSLSAADAVRGLVATADVVDLPTLGNRMLNVSRAAALGILQRLEGGRAVPSANAVLAFRTTRFVSSCTGAPGRPLGAGMAADCLAVRVASGSGGSLTLASARGRPSMEDPTWYELRDAVVGPMRGGTRSVDFTLHGNYASPGIGPATTRYRGTMSRAAPTAVGGVWLLRGTMAAGGASGFTGDGAEGSGADLRRCTWRGDWEGTLYESTAAL